jgi:hypothetical protein
MRKAIYASVAVICALFFLQASPQSDKKFSAKAQERIAKEVRHQILMLPYFGTFDNIAFKLNGYDVTLYGQVVQPSLKSDAERAVRKIEGVEHVDNQIEVLPTSPNDDRLRIEPPHPHHCESRKRDAGRRGGPRVRQEHGEPASQRRAWSFLCAEQSGCAGQGTIDLKNGSSVRKELTPAPHVLGRHLG